MCAALIRGISGVVAGVALTTLITNGRGGFVGIRSYGQSGGQYEDESPCTKQGPKEIPMPSKKPTAPMRRVLEGLNEAETTISPVTPASMMLVAQLKSAGLVQMCPILNGYEISPAGRRALKGGEMKW